MIDIAIEAAKAAGELAYRYFKTQPKVSYKANNSPVTRADIEAEKLIRKIISQKFPDHGIIGEELGSSKPEAKYQWVIDPIDGTKDFVRQNPFWGTLVAVLENGKPIIGVCFLPHSNEIFSAQENKGAYLNGKKTQVSKVSDLHFAYVILSSPSHFSIHNKVEQMVEISKNSLTSRYFSTLGYSLLWQAKCDVYVNAKGRPWDFAAPAVITEEAGGRFSDFAGKLSLNSNNCLLSNGFLHEQVLKILNSK